MTDIGTPVIERLRDATGFASHLVVRDGRDVVFVAKAWTHDSVMSAIKVNIGTRIPAHASVHATCCLAISTRRNSTRCSRSRCCAYTPHTPRTATEVLRARRSMRPTATAQRSSFEPASR
ncbi:IclR family transcriptional regulator domain-containing protein [Burkholderia cenocepacia]|uniref:IclR family transcriptional regulator domain-containing protein n=1 Tax=Burkholderia cenocepacia TaxID=95486 RepID=UPI001D125540|nr:hypothetical protein [Burkholderia cenocepacia]